MAVDLETDCGGVARNRNLPVMPLKDREMPAFRPGIPAVDEMQRWPRHQHRSLRSREGVLRLVFT
jgi:hypothetical protein